MVSLERTRIITDDLIKFQVKLIAERKIMAGLRLQGFRKPKTVL